MTEESPSTPAPTAGKPSDVRVRRALVDDLPALNQLWRSMSLDGAGLERRLTEFQVAVNEIGTVLGAIGFQMLGKQALLHSEGYVDFSMADLARPLLWERLQVVAANHGICRVWSRETAPFWTQNILSAPDTAALEQLPAVWNTTGPGGWRTIKLREDVEEILSADKEFALFVESERERSRSALRQAKALKVLATAAAIVLGVAVVIGLIYIYRHHPTALGR
jgi:hypothetical protein